MKTFVQTGQAPHYTDIARAFGITPDEGKGLLHDLMNAGLGAMWLHPDTDFIVTFGPFNNLPTQYRISIDDRQKWFAPGGFDALAVCWAFPGRKIQVDAPCLDCGEPIRIILSDGVIKSQNTPNIVGYTDVPLREWADNWSFTGGRMNLFRSEEHLKRWSGFKSGSDEGILSMDDMLKIFSTPLHTKKLSKNYVSSAAEYRALFISTIKEVKKDFEFWSVE